MLINFLNQPILAINAEKRILVNFMLVSQGDPQLLQLVGNLRISPSKSSKVNSSSWIDCRTPVSDSPTLNDKQSSWREKK